MPRLAVLAVERNDVLTRYVEKSDTFARTLVSSGTFGFIPEVPSAYTQPLYAWFLAGLYWPLERTWVVVGLAQIAVAAATALVVLAIGYRLGSVSTGVIAALVATLHPYLVWHDVHVNREILDGLVLALLVLFALIAYERASPGYATATGAVAGLAILLYVGSPQSKEGDERLEAKVDALLRKADPKEADELIRALASQYPKK